jgi:carbonic anhydrase
MTRLNRSIVLPLLIPGLLGVAALLAPVAHGAEVVQQKGTGREEAALDRLRKQLNEKIETASRSAAAKAPASAPPPKAAVRSPAKAAAREPDAAALAVQRLSARNPDAWSFDPASDTGPATWAQLKPAFSLCGNGQRQSPIDIRGGLKVDLEPIKFDYQPSGFTVIDTGRTVQANLGGGSAIEVNGRRFDLEEFHFHRPAEERINGRQYDMAVHMTHKDAEGRLAIVTVLLEAGKPHPVVQAVWNSLPLEKHEEQVAPGPIDLRQLLPEDRRYYTYMGSLSMPPCTEGVLSLVLKQPVSVSVEQMALFARLYPMNARPVQPLGGRLIKESN